MQTFIYEAKDASGQTVRGRLEAESERGAVESIRRMGYWVLRVKAAEAKTALPWHHWLTRGYFSFIFHRVGTKSLAIWYRSFSDLLGAGMNLYEAASTLAERTRNRTLRQAAREIAEAAHRGEPMSPVFDRYPSAFPLFSKALVQTGEETGLLDQTLEQLAAFYDSIYDIQMAYRMETFYPKLILFLFITIPPVIPAVTTVVNATGNLGFDWRIYLTELWARVGTIALWLAALWLGWRLLMQLRPLRQGWDRVKLIIPWVGGIVRRTSLARWARATAMMLRAGVPIRRALDASASATGNEAIAAAMRRENPRVMSGEPLSAVMARCGEFPEQAVDMVMTGERSGNVDKMLDRMADYYQAEATVASKQTAITVGVAFYLLMAVLVGIYALHFWSGYYSGVISAVEEGF